MVKEVIRTDKFKKRFKKIKDKKLKQKLKNKIIKIIEQPTIGKPLRYSRKGERTVYATPFRITYAYKGQVLYLLDFGHRDKIYRSAA